jgi:Tol biopolymer transport system component
MGYDIWILSLSGDRETRPFIQTRFSEGAAKFSPDGRWVAYSSDESGRMEIYVTPYPGPGRRRRISEEGGFWPRWSRDGRELFYVSPAGTLMVAGVQAQGNALSVGRVETLLQTTVAPTLGWPYDVSADGQRFLVIMEPEQVEDLPLTLVVNWTAGLHD